MSTNLLPIYIITIILGILISKMTKDPFFFVTGLIPIVGTLVVVLFMVLAVVVSIFEPILKWIKK